MKRIGILLLVFAAICAIAYPAYLQRETEWEVPMQYIEGQLEPNYLYKREIPASLPSVSIKTVIPQVLEQEDIHKWIMYSFPLSPDDIDFATVADAKKPARGILRIFICYEPQRHKSDLENLSSFKGHVDSGTIDIGNYKEVFWYHQDALLALKEGVGYVGPNEPHNYSFYIPLSSGGYIDFAFGFSGAPDENSIKFIHKIIEYTEIIEIRN